MKRWLLFPGLAALSLLPAAGQLVAPNASGVTLAQIRLRVRDVEAQKAFWISMIGGKLVKNGSLEMIQFPGVYITIEKGEPLGTAAGSVIDHFGFIFRDVPAMMAKWKANHFEIYQVGNPLQGSVHAPEDAVLLSEPLTLTLIEPETAAETTTGEAESCGETWLPKAPSEPKKSLLRRMFGL